MAAALLAEGDIRQSSKARFGESRADDTATERRTSWRSSTGTARRRTRASRPARSGAAWASTGAPRTPWPGPRRSSLASSAARAATRAPARPPPRARCEWRCSRSYPDRVARRVRAGGRALALAGGGSAELAETSVVRDAEWLVALDAEGAAAPARAALPAGASPCAWRAPSSRSGSSSCSPDEVVETRVATFDARTERVVVRESMTWGGLVLHTAEASRATDEEVSRVLVEAALAAGPASFAPRDALDRWLARARVASTVDASLAAPGEDELRAAVVEMCDGRSSFAELREGGLLDVLRRRTGARPGDVDRLAPERVTLAGGRSVVVQYEAGKPPAIASRLQDFFGMTDGPRIGAGRLPLVLELLAPNGRAVQVTTDLAGFWKRQYPATRKELMRRYPRHSWPEDPTQPAPRMRPR